jgi:YfiH family protein
VREHLTGAIRWMQFENLSALDGFVTHGVFTRIGGVSVPPYDTLNGGLSSGDDPNAVAENRARIVAALPGHPQLITTHPIHGANVVAVTKESPYDLRVNARVLPDRADSMITRTSSLGLFWAYADCTPVLIADPAHGAIALAHAGWRGTSHAIAVATLTAMREHFGTQPEDVVIGIGPSIGPCCYEVDMPVYDAFMAHPIAREHLCFSTTTVHDADGSARESLRLDVEAANRAQLLAAGVLPTHIESAAICTGCHPELFYSHRLEHGKTGRHAVVIALR